MKLILVKKTANFLPFSTIDYSCLLEVYPQLVTKNDMKLEKNNDCDFQKSVFLIID